MMISIIFSCFSKNTQGKLAEFFLSRIRAGIRDLWTKNLLVARLFSFNSRKMLHKQQWSDCQIGSEWPRLFKVNARMRWTNTIQPTNPAEAMSQVPKTCKIWVQHHDPRCARGGDSPLGQCFSNIFEPRQIFFIEKITRHTTSRKCSKTKLCSLYWQYKVVLI